MTTSEEMQMLADLRATRKDVEESIAASREQTATLRGLTARLVADRHREEAAPERHSRLRLVTPSETEEDEA